MHLSNVHSQYYNLGQDPASIRWRQIKTDHFKFIYPSDFEQNAQYLANLFQYVYKYGTITLDNKPSRVPIIMHNRDIVPNAFTLWAPRRIELYTCPPQNTYSQDWLQQLAIHEYRHIVQMDMVNHGFMKGLTWIVGEQATAAITGFYIPMWFMEGDAVCTETAMSHSGRGRVPAFEMEMRAQVLQKGVFSYDKAVLGSYKDHVPDQYVLGYNLVATVRKNYGYKTWVKAMDFVARKPYMITPLNHGLKKTVGIGKVALYNRTFKELDSSWRIQASYTHGMNLHVITKGAKSAYSRYKYPHYVNDSLLIAERTTLDDISRFVMIDPDGNEKILCTPGFFSTDIFSVNIGTGFRSRGTNKPGVLTIDNLSIESGLMAWTERVADPRWQNRNYSVIKLYDFSSGKTKTLTRQSRLFVPCISPDGKSLIAVKVSEQNKYSLVLIDVNSGKEIRSLASSDVDLYLTPSWSADGKMIVYMILNKNGKSIWSSDLDFSHARQLMAPTFSEISNPKFVGKYVFFNGGFSGIDNIYALDTNNLKIFQVTSSAFGAIDADYSAIHNKLVFSDYSSSGYRLVEAPFDPVAWQPLTEVTDHSIALYKSLSKEEPGMVDSTTLTHNVYNSTPYHKALHLFNFHSWAPVYFNYDKSEASTGVSFMSQNQLSTATTIAGYDWDYAGKTGLFRLSYTYSGWYPVLDVDATYGKIAFQAPANDSAESYRYTIDVSKISGGISLPLIFNQGKYYTGVQLVARSSFEKRTHNESRAPGKFEGLLNSASYKILVYHYIKQAVKDVYPKWGQVLNLNYSHTPFTESVKYSYGSIESTLYFPGIFRHNGIRLYAAYQKNWNSDKYYTDLIAYPRGTLARANEQMMSFRFNYKFPFLYPDLSLGSIAYFKRLKANLFYDHAYAWRNGGMKQFDSMGAELTTDAHFLRFLLPFDIGVRQGYRPIEKGWFTDFLFLINLNI
ncbi:MAG: hypothetical protein HXX13_06525 [Bacteroidetes bacterium]|nr:hypothetical protein [Bacteroidota bacterium]